MISFTAGDVVEVTTDGKTALVNGRLLNYQEQQALFASIKNKELNVKRRADMAHAVPVLPSMHKEPESESKKSDMVPQSALAELKSRFDKKREAQQSGTSFNDKSIEKMDLKSDYSFNPETGKQLLYLLKYGVSRGEDPNG